MQRESLSTDEYLEGPTLPPLPSLVRYHDDFEDCYRSVGDLEASNHWVLTINGRREVLRFDQLSGWRRRFFKVVMADLLASRASTTVLSYGRSLSAVPLNLLTALLDAIGHERPQRFLDLWIDRFRTQLRPDQMRPIRYIARTACRLNIGHWTESDADLVRRLPGASIDKFARARSRECFLPFKAQSEIVEYIDRAAARARTVGLRERDLIGACVLALSYQYGLRPGQTARIQRESVRRFQSGAVHIAVVLLKQRGEKRARTVVRPVQREWCVLFERLLEREAVAHNNRTEIEGCMRRFLTTTEMADFKPKPTEAGIEAAGKSLVSGLTFIRVENFPYHELKTPSGCDAGPQPDAET